MKPLRGWRAAAFIAAALPLANGTWAGREPVLKQIKTPHDYYFREMYLPQWTSGPGSLAWTPDGKSLVYSMAGTLWRQTIGVGQAEQLTAGPGYDYQPDVSPDGEQVVFVRYRGDAMELHLLELESGKVSPLTDSGAVNLEPRFSPDGNRLAFVSTRATGRFKVFVGELADGELSATQLVPDRESATPRYYYSPFDHELSPAWTPDGRALVYVSNREVPYGTGSIWLHPLGDRGEPRLVRREETTWKARPDVAPDGRRIAYASYLGRQWHQLWVTIVDTTAEPFPLSYGAFDIAAPRFSPDGERIAYIANPQGNTEIWIQELIGGKTVRLNVGPRQYLEPMADLELKVVGADGTPVSARVAVRGADGRAYAPAEAWTHADDGFDRAHGEFEAQYFHVHGEATLALPPGRAEITVWRGPEHGIERRSVDAVAGETTALTVALERLGLPSAFDDWVGGDVHVHMNYGGTYRNTPVNLVRQAQAEDLDVVFNLIVNKEQRIPDIAYFSREPDPASNDEVLLVHAQEFHTSFWGHVGLLGLNDHLLLPDYSGYPGTAAASLYPDNVTVAKIARAQQALIGYVHPFLAPPPDPAGEEKLTHALPVDAALGGVDYYEAIGFADHRASAEVWYRLLNCGLKIAAAAGSDTMANYASLRGPVGINRVYVDTNGRAGTPLERRDAWLAALKAGRSMATNGPLLGLTVDGRGPGGEIALEGARELKYRGFLRSAVPVDHLELVRNGAVVETIALEGDRTRADFEGRVQVAGSGWLLVRAWNEASHPLIFDLYPYATTGPVYVSVDGLAPRSPDDAAYFLAWIDRLVAAAESHPDYNSDAERAEILANLQHAKEFYRGCAAALTVR